jgi:DNA-binding Lrp family transcriptional regulator
VPVESVTLDDLDRRLVHALSLDGRVPFSRVAEVLGVSERTIARRYARLRSTGAVRVVGLPMGRRLGYVEWFVRVRCLPDDAPALAAALARRDDTSWVGVASGGTELTCLTRTRLDGRDALLGGKLLRPPRVTGVTAQCLLRPIAGLGGWPGRTSALTPHEATRLSPDTPIPDHRSTAGNPGHPDAPDTVPRSAPDAPGRPGAGAPGQEGLSGTGGGTVSLTPADRRLLPLLAADGRADAASLAAATGWSPSTVRRRLSELRRTGVLYFDVEFDPRSFGYAAEAMLWLAVAPGALRDAGRALAALPEIAFAAAVTGPHNIAAIAVCRDTGALYDLLADRIAALPGLRDTDCALITRRTKRSGTLLLPNVPPPVTRPPP